jgi:hypothetical protein
VVVEKHVLLGVRDASVFTEDIPQGSLAEHNSLLTIKGQGQVLGLAVGEEEPANQKD